MRRGLACCAALVVTLAAGAAPAGAQEGDVIARLDRATPIAAYGDVLAYSVLDPQSGLFRLEIRRQGIAAPAPVAPRAVPFDVDLGPTTTGGVAAVYSRCTQELSDGAPAASVTTSAAQQARPRLMA